MARASSPAADFFVQGFFLFHGFSIVSFGFVEPTEADTCRKFVLMRNEQAWKASVKEILANGCNLDRTNPSAKDDITHLPPVELAGEYS